MVLILPTALLLALATASPSVGSASIRSTVPSSAPAGATSTTCPDLVLLGVAGSGERKDPNQYQGVGRTVQFARQQYAESLPKYISRDLRALDYTAVGTEILIPSLKEAAALPGNPFAFWRKYDRERLKHFTASIDDGISRLTAEVISIDRKCKGKPTRIVLFGYSQGAMVIHAAEIAIARSKNPARSRIVGTFLIGDGYRQHHSKGMNFGTSGPGSGLVTWINDTLHRSNRADIPWPQTTINFNDELDLVGDFKGLRRLNPIGQAKTANRVHAGYVHDTGARLVPSSPNLAYAAHELAAVTSPRVPSHNPYRSIHVCGPGYTEAERQYLPAGYVSLNFKGSEVCVAAIREVAVGRAAPMDSWIRTPSGHLVIDRGSFKYYAGPVRLGSPGCLEWGGYVGGQSTSRWICDKLQAGQHVGLGGSMYSRNGRYQLAVQRDGNLVLHDRWTGKPKWSPCTRLMGKEGAYLTQQHDGNLVMYTARGRAVWASGMDHKGATTTIVQNDGNVVQYSPRGPVWASNDRC